jgi:hypothetical protein
MKKTLLSLFALVVFGSIQAQTTLFEDSFEDYTDFAIANVGNWTLVDVDELPTYGVQQGTPPVDVEFENSGELMAFIVMNGTASTPALGANWIGHTGNKLMAAMAAIPSGGVKNNDWLISPQIQLGSAGNMLKFWAKAISASYPEKFKVGISTTGVAPADFTIITTGTGVTPTTSWAQYSYNLDTYQGQNVYIAIQCVSNDAFAFMVDDFLVTATTLGTDSFVTSNFSVYPNPANSVLNISGKDNLAVKGIEITDLNGRIVKTLNGSNASQMQINISDLNTGMYFLKIKSELGEGTTKIMKN